MEAMNEALRLIGAEQDRRAAAYRDAMASVAPHRRTQAAAELAVAAWLKAHRGVPSDVLYDRSTGDALDPELAALEAALAAAAVDVRWCRAVVVAAGEAYKQQALADVPNDRSRIAHLVGTAV